MMAEGASPERISGNASETLSATSAKSQTIARPKPKPNASPCTSATLLSGEVREARLNSISRAVSLRMEAACLPARSSPLQNTVPRARMRSTRPRCSEAAESSSATIASNIAPVTSLPWTGLFSVNARTSPVRSMITPVPASGDEGTDWLGEDMRASYTRTARLSIEVAAGARLTWAIQSLLLFRRERARCSLRQVTEGEPSDSDAHEPQHFKIYFVADADAGAGAGGGTAEAG